jgi:hypothetical protein
MAALSAGALARLSDCGYAAVPCRCSALPMGATRAQNAAPFHQLPMTAPHAIVIGASAALAWGRKAKCGSGLWQLKHRRPLRYRCRTGHGCTAASLDHAPRGATQESL